MTRVNSKFRAKLEHLETLDHQALSEEWERVHGLPPPKASSRKFLVRSLSFELQSKSTPSLSRADRKLLDSMVKGDSDETTKVSRPTPTLHPGSTLMREWNGKTHMVSVIEEGFVYKDRVWKSLSAIAKDITGAHWSGPRFFGLNGARS